MSNALSTHELRLDVAIRFGIGSRRESGGVVGSYGTRCLLITGARSLDESPYLGDVLESLAGAGVRIAGRARQTTEPSDGDVQELADRLRSEGADVALAIGGGSVLDVAKAACVVAGGTDLRAALAGERVDTLPVIPVVAVPTTAGSGAEVSRGAIVLDRVSGKKRGVRGAGVGARASIVDPELTVGLSPRVTAESGFDALSHAVETALSRAAQPMNLALAGESLRRLLTAVPRALEVPGDLAARSDNAYAAMLMGLNLATSTTCLPHRLQYPVGALTGTRHAQGVAALMPSWLERVAAAAPQRLAELAVRTGLSAAGSAGAHLDLIDAILGFLDASGMRQSLSDLGVSRADIPQLVRLTEGTLENDPGPVGDDDLAALYEASL